MGNCNTLHVVRLVWDSHWNIGRARGLSLQFVPIRRETASFYYNFYINITGGVLWNYLILQCIEFVKKFLAYTKSASTWLSVLANYFFVLRSALRLESTQILILGNLLCLSGSWGILYWFSMVHPNPMYFKCHRPY